MPHQRKSASVVISTYYRNLELKSTIESVHSQTYPNIDLIVVDDSGEKHAQPILEEFSSITTVYNDKNQGAQYARQKGLKQANGEYIQFLDDDDRLSPKKIKTQIKELANNPDAGACYCGVRQPDGIEHYPCEDAQGDVLSKALAFDLFPAITSSTLVDAELLKSIQPLERLPGFQDGWLFIELALQTEFRFVNDILVKRSGEEEGISQSKGAIEGRWRVLEKYQRLYAQQPDWVYKKAISDIWQREADYRIKNNLWSPVAPIYFFRAFRNAPWNKQRYIKALLLSFFGQPGLQLGKKAANIRNK